MNIFKNFINKYFKNKTFSNRFTAKYIPEVCTHCGEDIIIDTSFYEKIVTNLCKRCFVIDTKIKDCEESFTHLRNKNIELCKEKNDIIDSINRNNIFNNTYPDNKQELNNNDLIVRLNEIKQLRAKINMGYDELYYQYNKEKSNFEALKKKE